MIKDGVDNITDNIKTSLHYNKTIYLVVAIYYLLTLVFFHINQKEINNNIYFYVIDNVLFYSLSLILLLHLFRMISQKHPSPLRQLFKDIVFHIKHPEQAINVSLITLSVVVVLTLYTNIKTTIGYLFPFTFDRSFFLIDKALHFGYSPWELTHSIFSSTYATGVINTLYNLWFIIMWLTLIYFLIGDKFHRKRYVIGFTLCWILLGNILAIFLPSAGPCFIQYIHPEITDYVPLFDQLNHQNEILESQGLGSIWALMTQEMLWNAHTNSTIGLGSGISAMPSLHVAIAVYMALSVSAINRIIGAIYWLFALFIQIGSVHLGWHYAIDGYVSAVLTLALWKGLNCVIPK